MKSPTVTVALMAAAILVDAWYINATARAEKPRLRVPPTHEIEILDPGVDPLGRPGVVQSPSAFGDARLIDVPPAVVVHRYYYSGDREFQGPMFPGGPCILVINHPETGCRLYLEANMVPGSPRVAYTKRSIEYDFGHQRITVKFSGWKDEPKVVYETGRPLPIAVVKGAAAATAKAGGAAVGLVKRTGAPELVVKISDTAHNAAKSGAERIHDVGGFAFGKIDQAVSASPLSSLFILSPEELALRKRNRELQHAADEDLAADRTLPTNR